MTETTTSVPQRGEPSALRWLWLSFFVVIIDQLSKALIVARFELFERRDVLPVLEITRLHNRGAAFSFLNDASGWQKYLFVVLAVGVCIGIVVALSRLAYGRGILLASGLALIMGGALGNVIDRVMRGYVVDFIYAHWQDHFFPAFNVADSAITVGAALLILDSLLESRRSRPAEPPPPADPGAG